MMESDTPSLYSLTCTLIVFFPIAFSVCVRACYSALVNASGSRVKSTDVPRALALEVYVFN